MITSMYKVLCVTNRHLAGGNFLHQMEKVAEAGVRGIILREKDMKEAEYGELAVCMQEICERYQVPLILHTYIEAAVRLGAVRIHLPYSVLSELKKEDQGYFDMIGVSVHSVEEAVEAQKKGASYVTAGHIFSTDCKKGLTPRGTGFLEEICRAVRIPVYAIGGIGPENAECCIRAGAEGICLMSSLMETEDPAGYLKKL